jgi:hypothetical protein
MVSGRTLGEELSQSQGSARDAKCRTAEYQLTNSMTRALAHDLIATHILHLTQPKSSFPCLQKLHAA